MVGPDAAADPPPPRTKPVDEDGRLSPTVAGEAGGATGGSGGGGGGGEGSGDGSELDDDWFASPQKRQEIHDHREEARSPIHHGKKDGQNKSGANSAPSSSKQGQTRQQPQRPLEIIALEAPIAERLERAAIGFSDVVHIAANEPTIGLFQVVEHTRRSVPQLRNLEEETVRLAEDCAKSAGDCDFDLENLRSIAALQEQFGGMRDLVERAERSATALAVAGRSLRSPRSLDT